MTVMQVMEKLDILRHDANYILVNKPPDIKINSNEESEITIETILKQRGIRCRDADSPKHLRHSYYWVHRLDYATSGVLCVGLTKQAARVAQRAFEERKVKKCYVALVRGHVDFEKILQRRDDQDVSMCVRSVSRPCLDIYAGLVRDRTTDFPFLFTTAPYNDVTNKLLRDSLDKVLPGDSSDKVLLSDSSDMVLPGDSSDKVLSGDSSDKVLLSDSSDKVLLSDSADKVLLSDSSDKMLLSDSSDKVLSGDSSDKVLLSGSSDKVPPADSSNKVLQGDSSDKVLSALTQVYILETGYYDEEKASKLLLVPQTGRSHQLRVHCKYIGHTIVGDYTYSNRADVRPHRMMLHSLSLTIPMQPLSENVCITAPDPFTTDSKWCPQKVHVTTEQLVSQLTL
ncbi:hypothetical protein EB796_011172 [Bugula neritina]|uniref:Pseudouridine synthase RsuA/RluA-like domain-containing protein n=1 Tax=Bugula neritina TaxID=10212 RepID=A0A7J7JXU8_BUGNE|nr:hypothetical protein EB796_011172 [Bugula neritina]